MRTFRALARNANRKHSFRKSLMPEGKSIIVMSFKTTFKAFWWLNIIIKCYLKGGNINETYYYERISLLSCVYALRTALSMYLRRGNFIEQNTTNMEY